MQHGHLPVTETGENIGYKLEQLLWGPNFSLTLAPKFSKLIL